MKEMFPSEFVNVIPNKMVWNIENNVDNSETPIEGDFSDTSESVSDRIPVDAGLGIYNIQQHFTIISKYSIQLTIKANLTFFYFLPLFLMNKLHPRQQIYLCRMRILVPMQS